MRCNPRNNKQGDLDPADIDWGTVCEEALDRVRLRVRSGVARRRKEEGNRGREMRQTQHEPMHDRAHQLQSYFAPAEALLLLISEERQTFPAFLVDERAVVG